VQLDDVDLDPLPPQGDGGGEASDPAAHDEDTALSGRGGHGGCIRFLSADCELTTNSLTGYDHGDGRQ